MWRLKQDDFFKNPAIIKNQAVNYIIELKEMWKRFISFVVVLIFTLNGESFAQKIFVEKNLVLTDFLASKSGFFIKPAGRFAGFRSLPAPLPQLPADLFVKQLGFICKKEWQLQKTTSIPFRFRLGSLAYTDYMERKPNSLKPQ